MLLSLENIGLIKKSHIEVSGLTLIVGNNGVGKSTVSRALYATMRSFYHLPEKAVELKRRFTQDTLYSAAISSASKDLFEKYRTTSVLSTRYANQLFSNESLTPSSNQITEIVHSYASNIGLSQEEIKKLIHQVYEIANIQESEVYKLIVDKQLFRTFSGQIRNLFHDDVESTITLKIKQNDLSIKLVDNHVDQLINPLIFTFAPLYISNFADIVHGHGYANDNASIGNPNATVRDYIYNQEPESDIVLQDKIKSILDKLTNITQGKLVQDESKDFWFVSNHNPEVKINPDNLASGLKTFLVLLDLLKKNIIVENATLILDEPEVHLHPEWQVHLANLLTLLQREFKLHLLISTHSPYFLSAIDVFSKRNGIRENTRFYTMNKTESSVDIVDITKDLSVAYNDLTRPFQIIEDMDF